MFVVIATLFVITTSYNYTTNSSNPRSNLFPHYQFDCDPSETDVYETEFIFLQGLGHGFVHALNNRVFFEYYFPVEHWVAFAIADQIIAGEQDHCSKCYFENYYPSSPINKNHSNLYPNCIEECLHETIVVGSANSDEDNINNWIIIEFQIMSQQSKKLGKKMYRIPQSSEILEVWGNINYPYRTNAHFETHMTQINIGQEWKQFVHVRFWRDYDYQSDQNAWKPFVNGPYQNSNTSGSDLFCFLSIGSFTGGAYPYADDALNGMLPGFYIDTEHFANIHCYKTNDIKVHCGQKTFADSGSFDSIEELESYDDSDTNNVTDANSYNNSKYINLKTNLKHKMNENQKSIPLFESKVSIDNVGDIFYRYTEPRGRGAHQQPDVLLLHGEEYGSATWKGLGTLQIFSYWGYKTVAIDLPAYKLSKKATPPYFEDEYIEFIRNIINKLGLSNVVLIVPSMSGIYGLPVLFADEIDLRGFIAIAPIHTNRYTKSQYESVNIPVMMMYGENDDTPYKSEMLYWMKNIPVNTEVMIKNGQHAPFVGNPDDFHKEILRFVSTECSIDEDTDTEDSYVLSEYVKKFIVDYDSLFTTDANDMANGDDVRIDDPDNIPYVDPSVTVNYECALTFILKIVAVGIIVIFCMCFCCMRKRRQRSMNILERVECDEFNEGFVNKLK